MNQALYAHMNNKRKKQNKNETKKQKNKKKNSKQQVVINYSALKIPLLLRVTTLSCANNI
jgi:hypothetical protein